MTPLYHYTVGIKLGPIYSSGVLAPSPAPPPELRILWLSANPVYEPTAAKVGIATDQSMRVLTLEEMRAHGGGVFRFAIDPSRYRLHPWPRLARRAHMPEDVRRRLVRRAAECNAKPIDWFGCLSPIAVAETELQQLHANGRWYDVAYSAVAEQAHNPRILQVRGSEIGVDVPVGGYARARNVARP